MGTIKKIVCFLAICFYIVGTVAGIGCCCQAREYFQAFCVLIVGVMAVPTLVLCFNELAKIGTGKGKNT